jgi:HK97 family phage portal protein
MSKTGMLSRLGMAIRVLGGHEVKQADGGGCFDQILELLRTYHQSKTGIAVNVTTALGVAAVFACTRVLSEGVAVMPWKVQRKFDDGRREFARDMPLYKILYRRPNEWQTAFEFREQMMYHAVLTGNAYAFINRDGNDRVTELLPLVPTRVTPRQDQDLNVTYDVLDAYGRINPVPRADIYHVRGPSWDGYRGMDVVRLAREAIGLTIAAEESQAELHRNGLQTSGIISFDGTLTEPARKRLADRIKEMQSDDSMGVLLLDQAAKFSKMTLSGVDAQHLETRRLQTEEVCRAFRVFPQMIGHAERSATYASAEQFFMAHVVHSLAPWVERFEQAAERDLIGDEAEQGDFEVVAKMSLQSMMRGDAKARAEFYASAIVNGWMTRAEARDLEDLPMLPGLDVPLQPLNMGQGGKDGQAPIQQGPNAKEVAPGAKPAQQDPQGGLAGLIASVLIEEFGAHADLASIEAKIGRVLSAANENRIQNARDLLNEVLTTLDASASAA